MNVTNTPIFIAGHGGLIGGAILRRLKAEGCRRIVTRARGQLDLRDAARVDAFFKKTQPKIVVLAAGRVGGIVENSLHPGDFISDNLAMQSAVLGAARRHGAQKTVFFGSSCMYPKVCPQPMAEERIGSGPVELTSRAYAAAKSAGVEMCLAFNAQDKKTRFLPLIPNSVYGPGDDFELETAHVLSALVRRFYDAKSGGAKNVRLWGTGKPRREFVHCDDLADAVWRILNADVSRSQWPMNVGSGEAVSIRDLAERVRKAVGYEGRVEWDASKPDGSPIKWLDSRRARKLGWRPRVSLNDGLRQTVDWYEARA